MENTLKKLKIGKSVKFLTDNINNLVIEIFKLGNNEYKVVAQAPSASDNIVSQWLSLVASIFCMNESEYAKNYEIMTHENGAFHKELIVNENAATKMFQKWHSSGVPNYMEIESSI